MDAPCKSYLSEELYEELCIIAEEASRKYITSKVSSRGISDLSVSVNLEESQGLNVEVDVNLALFPMERDVDEKKLAEEAVNAAFRAIDKYMSEAKCRSKT